MVTKEQAISDAAAIFAHWLTSQTIETIMEEVA